MGLVLAAGFLPAVVFVTRLRQVSSLRSSESQDWMGDSRAGEERRLGSWGGAGVCVGWQ